MTSFVFPERFRCLRHARKRWEWVEDCWHDSYHGAPSDGSAWVGEIYYVRKRYSEAAVKFFDAYKRFPKGARAPDNLLRLAKTLSEIGKDKDACTTYIELVEQFPNANQRILSKARLGMKKLSCEVALKRKQQRRSVCGTCCTHNGRGRIPCGLVVRTRGIG